MRLFLPTLCGLSVLIAGSISENSDMHVAWLFCAVAIFNFIIGGISSASQDY